MTAVADRTDIPVDDARSAPPQPERREGNPGLLGLPLIVPGALGLGAANTGLVSSSAAAVPILLSATAAGLLITTIWSAALRQNVNATIYGTFFGFYGSYGVLSLGLTHGWFGIAPADVAQTTTLWLASWLFSIGVLTVLTVRLPWLYPAVLAIVDVVLVLLLIGNQTGSALANEAAGWLVFVFVAIVVYFYAAALWEELGGTQLPLGRPLVS
jgi:succinate-acetate transporter protein